MGLFDLKENSGALRFRPPFLLTAAAVARPNKKPAPSANCDSLQ